MSNAMPNRRRTLPPTLARLPPLTALRAFVATARHLSFTRAADELHVTSAAVGQQIRLLEDHLGQPLFTRYRGELQLTDAGRELMPGLTEAFDGVVQSLARLVDSDEKAPIRVSVAPSFASKWLIPRLDALRRAVPGLEVLVDSSADLADPGKDDVDCVVRYGLGTYAGLVTDRLFGEAVLPVCSPAFALQHGLYGRPEAAAGVPLLHEAGVEFDASCPDWKTWLRTAGLSSRGVEGGITFSLSSLVIGAAIAGQGLGLAKQRLAGRDLAQGRLVSPFGEPRPVQSSYFFATTPAKANTQRVVLFRDWLLAESAADALPLQILAADRPHLVAVS
jgi:LysR family glycine cleavage system transcriptional activator